jgi:hypothetical protein
MRPAGYYKLPAAQTATENCVAHNGSLIPIPGRDVMVQAWYQGGLSVFDFTDPKRPREIAYFDRGPMDSTNLTLGGYWSTYWYNGHIYGSEIGRGFDVLELKPSELLSANEIEAAKLVRTDGFNPQLQTRITWPAHFAVARAYVDQLARGRGLPAARTTRIMQDLDAAERLAGAARARRSPGSPRSCSATRGARATRRACAPSPRRCGSSPRRRAEPARQTVAQSSGLRFATMRSRCGSRKGASTTFSPSVAASSSTANPGPSDAISKRMPFGSRK